MGVIVLIIGAMTITQLDFSNDENLDVFIEKRMKKSNVQGLSVVSTENGQIFSGNQRLNSFTD